MKSEIIIYQAKGSGQRGVVALTENLSDKSIRNG